MLFPVKPKNLEGQIFGKLTAIKPIGITKWRNIIWLCLCECGQNVEVRAGNLKSGNTSTCGCVGILRLKKDKDALALLRIGPKNGSWKGGMPSCKICKKILSMRNSKTKTCASCNGKVLVGPLSSNWKGGKTHINKRARSTKAYAEWRKAVFERDNYTCQFCGDRTKIGHSVVLNADHIKPFAYFPQLRLDINNGRTLCLPCHKTTDTYLSKAHKYSHV